MFVCGGEEGKGEEQGGWWLTVKRPKEMVPTNLERVTVALASGMLGVDDGLRLVRCCVLDAYRKADLGRKCR